MSALTHSTRIVYARKMLKFLQCFEKHPQKGAVRFNEQFLPEDA